MHRLPALVLALAATTCIPWPLDGEDDDEDAPWTPPRPTTPAKPGPPTTNSTARPDPGALGGFVDCLLRCDAPGKTRVARAECRYRCDRVDSPSDGAGPPSADIDLVETVARCMTRCPGGGERRACLDACERLTADSPAAPPASVLDELGACLTKCRTNRHLMPADRSTCERDCTAEARSAGLDSQTKP